MKKIIKKTVIILLTCNIFSSCENFLNLDPVSQLSPGSFWNTHEDATAWMAAIYNQMQRTFQSNLFDWGEIRSDHIRNVGTSANMPVFIGNRLQAGWNKDCISWEQLYTTINLCNIAIIKCTEMMNADIDGRANMFREYIAQCHGMRALMYFYGMRVWGRMPLMLDGVEGGGEIKPRASIAGMREQIMKDIETALNMEIRVLTSATLSDKYYLNRSAILALLTDVHAWFQEWDDVIRVSESFMSNPVIGWVAHPNDWKTLFLDPVNPVCTENVFVMYWERNEYGGNITSVTRMGRNNGTSDVGITADAFALVAHRVNYLVDGEEGSRIPSAKRTDARYWHSFDSVRYKYHVDMTNGGRCGGHATNSYQFGKFFKWDPNGGSGGGCAGLGGFEIPADNMCNAKIPIYRYVDVMTLRAEALALTGHFQEALDILNKVRSRVGYQPDEETDPTGLLSYYDQFANKGEAIQEVILTERQIEFFGEGKRWFDLCRVGKTAFTKPYYDESPGKLVPSEPGYYEYLKKCLNRENSLTFTDFEGKEMGRVFFPIYSGAFQANPLLHDDQNAPYDI